jgi:hypothetical protein
LFLVEYLIILDRVLTVKISAWKHLPRSLVSNALGPFLYLLHDLFRRAAMAASALACTDYIKKQSKKR